MLKIPNLNYQIWLLSLGRLLSQIGTGFTLFYSPIFFVDQVGLSAVLVGIGLGSGSISGVFGRIIGGSLCDLPSWGRKKTLILSAIISTIADLVLAFTYDFPILLLGNLLMGFGVGLYWPATEAVVADLTVDSSETITKTSSEQRGEAFAITRLADSLGLSLGVIFGGLLIESGGSYRILFIIDGVSFLLFSILVFRLVSETVNFDQPAENIVRGWQQALKDRLLQLFVVVNILFTSYFAQIQSTLPLYFKSYLNSGTLSARSISLLFTCQIIASVLLQLPIARILRRFNRLQSLAISLLIWGLGFGLVWLTGIIDKNTENWHLILAFLSQIIFALAMVSYTPYASAFVADLAPDSLRGIYLAINSQCWAVGYFIAPPLGGWALEVSRFFAHSFWLLNAISIIFGILILICLDRLFQSRRYDEV
jgi:MFS family permease